MPGCADGVSPVREHHNVLSVRESSCDHRYPPGRVDAAECVIARVSDKHTSIAVDRDASRIPERRPCGGDPARGASPDAVTCDRLDRPARVDAADNLILCISHDQ
jgi:hypothetical protein